MNSEQLLASITAITQRFLELVVEDEEMRLRVRGLAQTVLEATEVDSPTGAATSPPSESAVNGAAADQEDQPTFPGQPPQAKSEEQSGAAQESNGQAHRDASEKSEHEERPLPELTLGQSAPYETDAEPSVPQTVWQMPTDEDLPLIEKRCRLKAEGAKWAGQRRRLLAANAPYDSEIEPRDRDIIARAKAIPECYLWMCHSSGPNPTDLTLYDDIAGCFNVLADGIGVYRQLMENPRIKSAEMHAVLSLLAEAQSALRMAIVAVDGPKDSDQNRIFTWLKAAASENQIFIERHMKAGDPADPKLWMEIAARIEEADGRIQQARKRDKRFRKNLGKIEHKISLIQKEAEDSEEHWRILASAVDELVNFGMPPSNREIRELIAPYVDLLPGLDNLPQGFLLTLREIDSYLGTFPSPEPASPPAPTPEVEKVAELLGGRSMVLIGGERRQASFNAIKNAFELNDLYWIETREHQSIASFEPYVARPEVALVVLAIRWSSHSFGDVRDFCEKYDKPLVRLPAGYNPNQVAVQILEQCSQRFQS